MSRNIIFFVYVVEKVRKRPEGVDPPVEVTDSRKIGVQE